MIELLVWCMADSQRANSTFEIQLPFPQRRRVHFVFRYGWLLACVLLAHGCSAQTGAPVPPPEAVNAAKGRPQPTLPTVKLHVGTQEITAEIARTGKQIETGMMWRTNLNEMAGMIFVFPDAAPRSFWMKNCPLPLSCAYIDGQGAVLEVHEMKPFDESSIPSRSDRVQYVLEMNQGWFERHGIKPGTLVTTELGSLKETFFQRR